jgi:hypothetical protein
VERDLRLEEHAREQLTCGTCGNSVVDCADPDKVWYPYRRVCYATMERESSEARYKALHKDAEFHDGTFSHWSGKRTAETPVQMDEGVTIGVADRDLTPWDEFTTKRDASPTPPSSTSESSPT